MDENELPCEPEPELEPDEIDEELMAAEDGGGMFGIPDIAPSCYRCPEHGMVLAQDVAWEEDDQPHCPDCRHVLEPLEA
jgi:hypothetical protein